MCIALIALTGLSDLPFRTLSKMGVHGFLINLLLLQNFIRVGSVEGPLWSLPWEWQMYLVLSVLCLVLRGRRSAALALLLWGGIYLFHVAMLALRFNSIHPTNPLTGVVLWLMLTGMMTDAGYHLVERPCIYFGKELASQFKRRVAPRRLNELALAKRGS